MKSISYIVVALLAGLLIALPFIGDLGSLNLAIKVMIAAIFALGFNLLWGQAGLPSFGHAAYYGIGTFATIYAMQAIDRGGVFPTPLLPLVGAAAGFIFGLVAGWFATIRTGVYFAMITVALAELVSAIAVKWEGLFGGESGLRSIRSDWGPFIFQSTTSVYYLTLVWAILVMLFLYWIQGSPFGLIVRGIRERELRVKFLGYDARKAKTLVFALSAAVSGLAGALLAISDESANMVLFQGAGSAFVVLNTVIGGANVFFGPVIGAVLTTCFGYFGSNFSHFWMFYLGVAFVVTVLFAPEGIGGAIVERVRQVRTGDRAPLNLSDIVHLAALLLAVVGLIILVEVTGTICSEQYRASIASGQGVWPAVKLMGIAFNPLSPLTWIAGVGALGIGAWVLLKQGRAKLPAFLRSDAVQVVGTGEAK
ncbi:MULTISPECIES: branched-chain amino acid ABC transporter permease [unclassified Beijerinckia]|uniref:branched-chain amino acid ABC transporter permease n=1 Tax=unclassified Beijerinckia TaxID=2638183 RepID=UPI0008942D54|nr:MULTISPECIES: branched-chain amino acid ABC transporter permease [unclassified Beijerinckia]MDH7796973.1 branched-chain amino acid transport system permease protein [Beijerinckia sp. GAS462]SEC67130.1 amino acid/amide ABC transporter membrane protein 2, HAAT family [Beijerinckia sp. 28-YEA-48]